MSGLLLRKHWHTYLYWLKKEIFLFMEDFVGLKIFPSLWLIIPFLWLCSFKDSRTILLLIGSLWFARQTLLWFLKRREYYKAAPKRRLSYMAITATTPFYLPIDGLYLGEFENIEKAYSAALRKLSIQYKVIGVVAVDYKRSISMLLK